MSTRRLQWFLGGLAITASAACSDPSAPELGPSTFHVEITSVNGSADLPTAEAPLPANRGERFETWEFAIEARDPTGKPAPFDGVVRLSTRPGAIAKVLGEGAIGRNVRLKDGKASGSLTATAVYGPTRLWVEDLGYLPAADGKKPACSNGKNDDSSEDGLIDFPSDPGCAYADDDTEEGGSFAAGVSLPIQYALPKISDIQGGAATSPYPFESIEANTRLPQRLVVTRVSSDGFYVTDVDSKEMMNGYNSLFAFNFSTPAGMRVCDRVTYLSGTISEFFGFTELGFPSYELHYLRGDEPCEVPEPTVVEGAAIVTPASMEKLESGLVRIQGYHVAKHFGPRTPVNNVFADPQNPDATTDSSNCDLNGDGQVDFNSNDEGSCSNACSADPDCSEWTSYVARGNFKVSKGPSMIQIQTGTVATFDPVKHRGVTLDAVTGTLRNFSGGTLNWTIETRCPDDLVCSSEACICEECAKAPVLSKDACVRLRSIDDNDEGTN